MAIRFHMPALGDRVRLVDSLTFRLHAEYRNHSLFEALGLIEQKKGREVAGAGWPGMERYYSEYKLDPGTAKAPRTHGEYQIGWATVALPPGTVLQLDRIYIRKGASDFDSLTFLVVDSPDARLAPKGKKPKGFVTGKVRFWIKLQEMQGTAVEWLEHEPVKLEKAA
jgi:hypothetical protein